jgi:hypothetical protein
MAEDIYILGTPILDDGIEDLSGAAAQSLEKNEQDPSPGQGAEPTPRLPRIRDLLKNSKNFKN